MRIAMSVCSRRLLLAISFLAMAGIAVSSVSVYHHYGGSKTSYCDVGENFNCDIVNRSAYSSLLGIPVASIGIIGYLGLLALSTVYRRKAGTPILLLIASVAGLGFALYLTYIERFILAAWCVLCLSSLALIFSICVLSSLLVARNRAGNV
jgi:vitamin-K-epoxide reductase (warfarin-sensitive)